MTGVTLLILVVFVAIAVLSRVFAGGMDGNRVAEYIRSQGGELIESRWAPFGRGWVGEKNDRIYHVKYRDREGKIYEATVKTSMYSGVYFTENRVVQSEMQSLAPEKDLALENEELKKRIAELESQRKTS